MHCEDQLDRHCLEGDWDEDFGSSLLTSSSNKAAPRDLQQMKIQWSTPKGTGTQARMGESNSRMLSKKDSSPIKDNLEVEHRRCIIHVDLDCFYAQVEMVRNPDLYNVPLGIQQKYLLVTCNYVARSRGVKKLMTIAEAKRLCPDLYIVNGEDLDHYRRYSDTVHNFMTQYTSKVEKLGFDENFLDVTEVVNDMVQECSNGGQQQRRFSSLCGHLYNEEEENMSIEKLKQTLIAADGHCCDCGCFQRLVAGSHLAQKIRDQLYQTVGFTSCAGVAHNKLLSKMIGELHKPNQQTTIFPSSGRTFLRNSRIRKIPGIGYRYSETLTSLGVTFVRELQTLPTVLLQQQFGARIASFLAEVAQGIDRSDVGITREAKSMSEEESFKELRTYDDARKEIRLLIGKLIRRLKSRADFPGTIRLSIRNRKGSKVRRTRESKQMPFDGDILKMSDESEIENLIFNMAISLFGKLVDATQDFDLSLINLCFTNFKSTLMKTKGLCLTSFISPKGTQSADTAKPFMLPWCNTAGRSNQTIVPACSELLSWRTNEDMETKLPCGEEPPDGEERLAEDQQGSADFDKPVGFVITEKPLSNFQKQTEGFLSLPTTDVTKKAAVECLPANIDRQVFLALPEEIKAQLRLEWNIRKEKGRSEDDKAENSSVTMFSSKRKLAPNSRNNTKRVKRAHHSKDTSQTDISKFFSK